jgi:hypothetical protein
MKLVRFALIAVFLILPTLPGFSIVKERYGGNLKAAEDLLAEIFSVFCPVKTEFVRFSRNTGLNLTP